MTRVFSHSKQIAVFSCIIALSSCASESKKFNYPATTSATTEIQQLDQELHDAGKRQANAFSPKNFSMAQEKLADANEGLQKAHPNAEVLEDLGSARAYLDSANSVTAQAEKTIPGVMKARSDALAANSYRIRTKDLEEADRDLTKTTRKFEDGDYAVSVDRQAELQKQYQGIELAAIKSAYLDESRSIIENAKKLDAKKLAKQTLANAETKYLIAERTIETDRHNTAKIRDASDSAHDEAKRLLKITKLARGAKEGSPEAIALELESRQSMAERSRLETQMKERQLTQSKSQLESKIKTLGTVTAENEKLSQEQSFNRAFKTAQNTFSKNEADTYRQGDNLILRLKNLEFKSGRSDLPGHALETLSKVKDVVTSMDADRVIVEGHTDSTGSRMINMKLSEERAQAVATYLVSLGAVTEQQVETKGYASDKPIATNKTVAGRMQNRRVDLVISPSRAKMAADETSEE